MVNLRSHTTRLGVLDIGSNTIHMLIVDAAPGARPDPEASTKSTVRLMKYLKDDGSIKKSGIEAILEAVSQCMRLAEEYEITQLLVMATSALREAPNGNKVIHKIEELIGQGVTVLSGTDEARLTFLAARRWYGWDAGRLLVLDIGGGSLEVAMGSDEEPTVALSAPAGAGRVTTEFLPSGMATPDELEDVRKNVRKILEPMVKVFPQSKHPNHAVGTSKTFRSLARLCGAVMRAPGREDSWIMTREQLEDWIPRLAAIAPEQRVALPGITPERTMQIVGGGVVAYFALTELSGADPNHLIQSAAANSGATVASLGNPSDSLWHGVTRFFELNSGDAASGVNTVGGKLHMIRPADDAEIPWTALCLGLWIPNFFYWGLNQYIMQRTLASKSLAEGQMGIVFAAFLKLIIPFVVVVPGILA